MTAELVTVELLRPVARGGRLHEAGATLRVPLPEADSMFKLGFAAPAGAPLDFGQAPRRSWIRQWRT